MSATMQMETGTAEMPSALAAFVDAKRTGEPVSMSLDTILPGDEWASARTDLIERGQTLSRDASGKEWFMAANFGTDGNVMEIAAAIPRNPGTSLDYLNQVSDYQNALNANASGRKDAIALFHKIYKAEGTINNAINKMAALIGAEGSFKVRGVKGQRGKAGDKVSTELETALNWWKDNLNARGDDMPITGDRGVSAWISRGARLALIEGSHITRHIWPKAVAIPNLKAMSMPMTFQSFSAQHIEIPIGLEGTNYELFYWKPPAQFVSLLSSGSDPNLTKMLKRLIEPKVSSELQKNGKYLLDPNLLIHIKNRGTGVETFGESVIESAMSDVRYKRALDALEVTTITNLINRLVIVKVGSDNENSVYHKAEVTSARLGLLQRLMRNVGTSATVLWGGPDLEVVEVGAHNAILALDDRYRIAERRLLMALGVPAVLMTGEGGGSGGVQAALGITAQLREVQNQYKQSLSQIGMLMASENGYEDADVVWEFQDNLLENEEAAAQVILKLFQMGLVSTQTALEGLGFDYGAEQIRQTQDVTLGYKANAFGAPQSVLETMANVTGMNGDQGRPPTEQTGTPDPRTGQSSDTAPKGGRSDKTNPNQKSTTPVK